MEKWLGLSNPAPSGSRDPSRTPSGSRPQSGHEKHKKKTVGTVEFSTIAGVLYAIFRYFSTIIRIKRRWSQCRSGRSPEISGFLHIDSIYVYSIHFPIYGCIKACIKKTIREALQILHLSEYVLCIHGNFYIKMEPKCMYIQCIFIHRDAETVAITG